MLKAQWFYELSANTKETALRYHQLIKIQPQDPAKIQLFNLDQNLTWLTKLNYYEDHQSAPSNHLLQPESHQSSLSPKTSNKGRYTVIRHGSDKK